MAQFQLILSAIVAALQFPDAVLRLVNVLRKTEAQKHAEILDKTEEIAKKFEKTGRPTWT